MGFFDLFKKKEPQEERSYTPYDLIVWYIIQIPATGLINLCFFPLSTGV